MLIFPNQMISLGLLEYLLVTSERVLISAFSSRFLVVIHGFLISSRDSSLLWCFLQVPLIILYNLVNTFATHLLPSLAFSTAELQVDFLDFWVLSTQSRGSSPHLPYLDVVSSVTFSLSALFTCWVMDSAEQIAENAQLVSCLACSSLSK